MSELHPTKASDLMRRPVWRCAPKDSLERAMQLMLEHDVGCLVVTDDETRPIGLLTDRDVAIAALTRKALLRELRVGDAMTRHVRICSLDSSSSDVEGIMRTGRVHRVPVVDAEGALAGIVSLSDLARHSQLDFAFAPEMAGVARTLAALAGTRPT
jgi:CBS domain-containing protein